MSEWRDVQLKDVLQPKGYIRGPFGSALRRNDLLDHGIPVYEQQHAIYGIRDFRFYIDNEKYEAMRRFATITDDIIISCSGTLGRVSRIKANDPKGIISQALLLLRVDAQKIRSRYLQYFLSSKEGFNAMVSRSGGSVQVNLARREIIETIPFGLPDLQEQDRILGVLSSLDDKIELLCNQNRILESLAKTYFRQWFVESKTQTGRLDSIAKITMGQSPKGDSYNEEGLGTVFFQGRAEFGWRFPTIRLYTTSPQRMAQKGDILMSVRAPVGDINIAIMDCCIGRGLAAIRSEYPTFTLYAIKGQGDQLEIFNGEGTVFGSISKDGLNGLSIPMPSKKRIQEFEDRFSILDEKIKANSEQVLTLQKLRDTLLPKLISGEIRVNQ